MVLSAVPVVIPTIGRWERLGHTLASVLGQVDVDVLPIVVDDSGAGSPPRLGDDVEVVATRGREGEGAARALGTERASHLSSAPWIAYCDDDDEWEPSKLRRQLEALDGAAGWCLTGARRVGDDDEDLGNWSLETLQRLQQNGELRRRLLTHNPVPAGPSSVLVDRELLAEAGGWNPAYEYFADWDCWIRLSSMAEPVLLDEPLVRYRVWPGQMIGDRSPGWEALDRIRIDHAEARQAHGVGPLDDRVIAWILLGELRRRRPSALWQAATRLRPRSVRHLAAIGRYVSEIQQARLGS